MGGDVVPMGNMVINRIADMRRVAGLRHRFDTGTARQEKPRRAWNKQICMCSSY